MTGCFFPLEQGRSRHNAGFSRPKIGDAPENRPITGKRFCENWLYPLIYKACVELLARNYQAKNRLVSGEYQAIIRSIFDHYQAIPRQHDSQARSGCACARQLPPKLRTSLRAWFRVQHPQIPLAAGSSGRPSSGWSVSHQRPGSPWLAAPSR